MFYKRCTRCNKRLDYNVICSCKVKYKTNSDDYKSEKEKKFYKSKQWQNTTNIIKNRFNHLDIYSYYVLGIVEEGEVVHHIEELEDNWDKRLSLSNLIYLTEKNHRKIHNLMKKSIKDKENIQNLLFFVIQKFDVEFKTGGGYKKII